MSTRPGDACRQISEETRRILLDATEAPGPLHAGGTAQEIDRLPDIFLHLESCPRCRKRYGNALALDRALRHAFRGMNEALPGPSPDRLAGIFEGSLEASPTATLLRRVRRPVRTMLWFAVVALSTTALAALAWVAYRLITRAGG